MPKFCDLLAPAVSSSGEGNPELYVKLAYALGMSIERAQRLYNAHGPGHIYTSSGTVFADTPRHRFEAAQIWGKCFIVSQSLHVSVKTRDSIGKISQRKPCRERVAYYRERERYAEKRRLERLFQDGQGVSCPKRQGKANSHADIGRYVPAYGPTLNEYTTPKRIAIYVDVRINH